MLIDIFPGLADVKYLMLIDASSQYHNLNAMKIIILNNIFLSIWQVPVHNTTVWSSTSR